MATILVVDDEEACRTYLPLLLREDGHDVRAAATGHEAIAVGTEFRPDVLVADYLLKDTQDGVDVARALQAVRPDMKIILMTGLPADHLTGRLQGVRVLKVLEKPLDIDAILNEIRRLLPAT